MKNANWTGLVLAGRYLDEAIADLRCVEGDIPDFEQEMRVLVAEALSLLDTVADMIDDRLEQ